MADSNLCLLQACSGTSAVEYKPRRGGFIGQLRPDPNFPGRFKLLAFPALKVALSVQAGPGFRSAFETDWGPREHPFPPQLGDLELARATHFEVCAIRELHVHDPQFFVPVAHVQEMLDSLADLACTTR